MRGPTSPVARRAIQLYDDTPRGDRLHVRARWWTCPFPLVEREIPVTGRVLEVGCGHGLLSLLVGLGARGRQVRGIDHDEHKIDLARAAAAQLLPGEADVEFSTTSLHDLGDEPWDAVVMADVCYLLPPDARTDLLRRMAALVAPDGVLVLKEVAHQPVWKWQLSELQERLATGALGITKGQTVEFAPVGELAAPLVASGLSVRHERIDRGYPYAHHLLVGRRPGAPTGGDA